MSRMFVASRHRVGTDKWAARKIGGLRARRGTATEEPGPENIREKIGTTESTGGGLADDEDQMQIC